MFLKIALFCSILAASHADKDGKRWVWDDNNRSEARNRDGDARYEVFENEGPYSPNNDYNEAGNRPSFGGAGPIRPPNERPGGVYGGGNFGGDYGEEQSASYYPERPGGAGVLTGPVPSWVKQGPFKNFDTCKCTERFNCKSPGISYGHCDTGKQYCCYSTNKKDQLGGPPPSKPIHSLENGILVGPGGPVDPIPGVNVYPRPPLAHQRPGLYQRPGGNYARPQAGFGLTPSGALGNTYSAGNGILSGPGGPIDRPYRGGYARSAKD